MKRSRPIDVAGFTIVEPLILFVLLLIVSSGTAVMMDSINRNSVNSRLQIKVNEDIESDIATVRGVADRFTCCAGTCVVAMVDPATGLATFPSDDTGTATSSCATNNPRSGAFFFPTRDDPTTTTPFAPSTSAREPDAVTDLCLEINNIAFMTPLLAAVNALPNPPAGQNFSRAASIQPGKVLRLTYTDTINSRVSRVITIVPPMAKFCT